MWNGSTDVKATQKRLTELKEFFKKIGGYREIHTGNWMLYLLGYKHDAK